jgi:hypothetical protein
MRLHAHLKLGAVELDLENLLILECRVKVVQADGRHFLDVLGRGWLLGRGHSGHAQQHRRLQQRCASRHLGALLPRVRVPCSWRVGDRARAGPAAAPAVPQRRRACQTAYRWAGGRVERHRRRCERRGAERRPPQQASHLKSL